MYRFNQHLLSFAVGSTNDCPQKTQMTQIACDVVARRGGSNCRKKND
jgi:hypothetical protein